MSSVIDGLILNFSDAIWPSVFQILIAVMPVLVAIILGQIFVKLWIRYVRAQKLFKGKYILLELRLPKDTFKSPLAMEVFLQSIHNTADGSKFAQFWDGSVRPWYSLEIISLEGEVKFMAWMDSSRRNGFSSALYAQFPGIEIIEREDYAKTVHFDPSRNKIWGTEFKLVKEDAYPIKTYVDYGLDRDPKEEFKVDPMLPMIEFLGNVPPNQQVWIQVLIMAHKKRNKPGSIFKKYDHWDDQAKKIVNDIMGRDKKSRIVGEKNEKGFPVGPTLSKGEQEVIQAVERSLTKLPFDVGIRALYIAPKDQFDMPTGAGGVISSFNHFTSGSLNGFKPNGDVWKFMYEPWEDFRGIRRARNSKLILMAYKRRSYFYPPFEHKPFVLNTEELATVYHFPGSVAATPTLSRIPSKKGEAPSNLPI